MIHGLIDHWRIGKDISNDALRRMLKKTFFPILTTMEIPRGAETDKFYYWQIKPFYWCPRCIFLAFKKLCNFYTMYEPIKATQTNKQTTGFLHCTVGKAPSVRIICKGFYAGTLIKALITHQHRLSLYCPRLLLLLS